MEFDSYLSEKQRKRRGRRKWLYIAAGAVAMYLLVVGAAWLFLHAPFFRVDSVTVSGASAVPVDEVIALAESAALRDRNPLKAFLGYDNMLIWPSALATSDLAFEPRLASVTLSKDYFSHAVAIQAVERMPFGIWCFVGEGSTAAATTGTLAANESCFWFDAAGVMFARTLDAQGSLVSVVHDSSQTSLALGQPILPSTFIPNLVSVVNVIRASGVGVADIALKDITLQEIDVTTYNGPALYFSLRFPADDELPVLRSLMTGPNFAKLQYVDFRVQNRAYYK